MIEKIAAGAAVAFVSALLGWASTALTLVGRVTAIEASLVRIEARLSPPPGPGAVPPLFKAGGDR